MQCFAIGDGLTILGLKLAGIPGVVVTTPEQASAELQKAMKQEDVGLILITERIANTINEEVEQAKLKKKLPLVLEIPDREGPIPGRETIFDLIRRTIGIRL